MGMPATKRWTADEVRAMQDASRAWPRYELIDGELLVTPAPSWNHQEAVMLLLRLLADYLDRQPVGRVVISPADIALEPGSVLQPDVFVVPARDVRPRGSWRDVRSLLLAAEVLSPSSGRADRVTKRRFFQRQGVPEYWIVDVDSGVVERWRVGDERPELPDERLAWQPEGAAEPFVLELVPFFARVRREDVA
jgi:Uma2 family endonuclease